MSDAKDCSESAGLELGTGAGFMSSFFAEKCRSLSSVDVVDERQEKSGYDFRLVENIMIPFENETFDFVISNQVIEHVAEQREHVEEVFRVLKKGGVAYFSTPNRYWHKEVHSQLYFLGYFPRQIASAIFRFFRKGTWDVYPLSYSALKRMLANYSSELNDYGADIVMQPEKYFYTQNPRLLPILGKLPTWVLRGMTFLMPCFFITAKKV